MEVFYNLLKFSRLALLGIFALQLPASTITVGYLNLGYDVGLQTITVDNITGLNSCSNPGEVCDLVSFVDWKLTVEFTGSPAAVFTAGPDITPQYGYSGPWAFTDPSVDPTKTITQVTFTGSLEYSPIHIYSPLPPGTSSFEPLPFTAILIPDPWYPDPVSGFAEITVSDLSATPGAVPEPATWSLMLSAALAAACVRLRRR